MQAPVDLLAALPRGQRLLGAGDVAAVEGGLRQREPGASILGPEGRQFHLGRRCVLAGRWGSSV